MTHSQQLGTRPSQAIGAAGWTQRRLAAHVGVSENTMTRIIRGQTRIDIEAACVGMLTMGFRPAQLLDGAPIMRRLQMRTVDNPIISKTLEVEFGLGGPALRAVIHALRETGHPICSNSKGYFIGSREDVLSTIESLDQRARSIQSTVDGLRLSLRSINVKPSKLEQMEMF